MILSIIIPVYNLESYIAKTLESCLHQDIPSDQYEIICINDGSVDKSAEIISEYMEKHPNIKLFSQKNAGVSVARNKGIELAQGKYIWFVDGDDMIATNCLAYLLATLKESNSDIFLIGMKNVWEREFFQTSFDGYTVCPSAENKLSFMTDKGGGGGGVCRQLFRTDLLKKHGLKFNPDIKYSEDVLFGFKALIKAEVCAKTKSELYYYYQRQGSAMHSGKHINHAESMYLLSKEYLKIAEEEADWRQEVLRKKDFAIKALLFSLARSGNVKLSREWIKRLREEGLYPFPLLWSSLKGTVTLKQALINYSSFLFPWKWYFMTCVRFFALKNRLRRKS